MRNIVRIRFGSHLYGTSTPQSDIDYKSVFIPSPRDIILQKVKGTVSTKRPKSEGEKNYAGEIDEEAYSLQKYLKLLAEGQTVVLDMLFAPLDFIDYSQEWLEIKANKDKLLTRKYVSFVGYCRQQANKYGIKGSRVSTARKTLQFIDYAIDQVGHIAKLKEIGHEVIVKFITDNEGEHLSIVKIDQGDGSAINHLDVCGRKLSYNASLKLNRSIVQHLFDEYGHRAIQAERQEGIDWKALSHAVRIGHQSIEFLQTGNITFPLENAAHILAIKTGSLKYQEVAEEIENLLVLVENESKKSQLRPEPDYQWIDDFVFEVYSKQTKQGDPCEPPFNASRDLRQAQ